MADIIKSIITRLDTTANWTTLNPIPANGEQCIEILKKGLFKLKIGDGVTPWLALKYETLSDGYEKFKKLLEKEVIARQEGDEALQIALIEGLATKVTHYDDLPEITEHNAGEIAQYIGKTTKDYTEGYFYKAIYDPKHPDRAHWERISVQPETDLTPVWEAIEELDNKKVDTTHEAFKIYGTDEDGNQVVYDKDSFGKVEDVQLNGISVVDEETKIANIEPKANDVDYTTKTFTEVTTVKEALDTIIGDEITFGYTTSTAVGGLPKNTDINNWTLAQVMKQILSPTAVTEPTLSLGNIASTSGVAGSTHKFTKGTTVAVISWTAGTSTNPGDYILTGINADRFEIDGTNIKLKADETFVAGTTGALTFGVSRTYKIVNSLGKTETKTASATNGSLAYSATYPSYIGTTEEIATDFITSITSAIGLKPILGEYAETKNSAYTSYTIPDKGMLTYTNRLVIINKGIYTKIKDASGDITGNFKITSKSLSLDGTATATYTIAVLVNPSAGYKDTLTIS